MSEVKPKTMLSALIVVAIVIAGTSLILHVIPEFKATFVLWGVVLFFLALLSAVSLAVMSALGYKDLLKQAKPDLEAKGFLINDGNAPQAGYKVLIWRGEFVGNRPWVEERRVASLDWRRHRSKEESEGLPSWKPILMYKVTRL